MENEIIIDKFKYEKSWEMFSRNILKMVIPKLKTLGYKLHISEEYLNIDGMQYWFKHPQRIAKLVLNIRTDITTLSNKAIELNEISIIIAIDNSINAINDYWMDYNDVYQDLANITNIKNNTFKSPTLNFSVLSKMADEINKFDRFIFNAADNKMSGDFINRVHGAYNDKNVDFSSLENYIAWLEWLGIDVINFAISHKTDDLLPQTAKDAFLF